MAIAGVIAMEPKVLIPGRAHGGDWIPGAGRPFWPSCAHTISKKGNTVILVSHSMEEIARNVDRIVVMSHSHKLMDGTPGGGILPGG